MLQAAVGMQCKKAKVIEVKITAHVCYVLYTVQIVLC